MNNSITNCINPLAVNATLSHWSTNARLGQLVGSRCLHSCIAACCSLRCMPAASPIVVVSDLARLAGGICHINHHPSDSAAQACGFVTASAAYRAHRACERRQRILAGTEMLVSVVRIAQSRELCGEDHRQPRLQGFRVASSARLHIATKGIYKF